jgi:2-hydroxy-3-keto-5-methylthiopentenyl-1-phosphate phosphatase
MQMADLLETNLYKVKDFFEEVEDNFISSLEILGYVFIKSNITNELGEPYWEVYVHPSYVELINEWLNEDELDLELISARTGRVIPKGAVVFFNTLED